MASHTKPGLRAFAVIAADPETGEQDRLGVWRFDEEWSIEEIEGVGEYQEMLEEIADELNDQDTIDWKAAPGTLDGKKTERIERSDSRFIEALRMHLKDEFDLEMVEA